MELKKTRTMNQNKALHVYFELLADELNNAGYDMRKTLKESVEIPWSKEMVKEYLWKAIQEAQLRKCSTTELSSDEIDKVYETLNRMTSQKFGIGIPFPSEENRNN